MANLPTHNPPSAEPTSTAFDASTLEASRAMNRFYETSNWIYHRYAARSALSDSAFDVLYALAEQDGRQQKDLANASFMTKQTLHSSLKRLQEKQWVRVEVESRRMARVFLTDEGWEAVRLYITPAIEAEHKAMSAIPPAIRKQIPELLKRYTSALEEAFDAIE